MRHQPLMHKKNKKIYQPSTILLHLTVTDTTGKCFFNTNYTHTHVHTIFLIQITPPHPSLMYAHTLSHTYRLHTHTCMHTHFISLTHITPTPLFLSHACTYACTHTQTQNLATYLMPTHMKIWNFPSLPMASEAWSIFFRRLQKSQ